MKCEIVGTTMPMVTITLSLGEGVQCQAGAMKWIDSDIDMKTKMPGGLGGLVKRSMMGAAGFLNTYEARSEGARIAFGHTFPGKVLPIQVGEMDVICRKRTFLRSEYSEEPDIAFQKRPGTEFFGGEGFVLTTLTGPGKVWLQTMSIQPLAREVYPYLPSAKSK